MRRSMRAATCTTGVMASAKTRVGANGPAPDIGAFELQADANQIFRDGFQGGVTRT